MIDVIQGGNSKRKLISIVIPVYNEEESIRESVRVIISQLEGIKSEIVLINDGSTDNSWHEIETLHKEYSNIYGLSLSRNFGKEAALLAGLAFSHGDAVLTMDADMQHPPEKIPEFIKKWEDGKVRIVEGIKEDRGDEKVLHSFFAKQFYRLMSFALGKNFSNMSDYKLLDREVVNIILQLPEKEMFYRAITSWVGFETDKVYYQVSERKYGQTKWSSAQLFAYALRNVSSFTSAPLQIITICSLLFFLSAVVFGVVSILKWASGSALEGFTTVILLQLIIGSIIMFALGLIGYYLSILVEGVRNRPRYIVEEKLEYEKDDN